ncbi:E3 ubiquitin-protein ligase CHIP-like isoform X3 [Anneissia japonica]|uniref:E3 ubiquitin-protein ligase CHIP-like isoform X3 n=1 Tax=Anneissia japonica TaxID=1529436 RepID=UPI0014257763|nr:E3 ubiquitin-protein ligase CHIP-like isoform X3 [Anneissia japonica]
MSVHDLKDQGNRFYSAKKFDEAISCYSKAIVSHQKHRAGPSLALAGHAFSVKNQSYPALFTNRALCYVKLKKWAEAAKDCRQAIEMDQTLVKGHFFLGQALLEKGMYDEAITSLKKACDLAKDQKLNYGDDITSALRCAKKKRWNFLEEKRIQQDIELQSYLNRLMIEDKDRKLKLAEDGSKITDSEKLKEKVQLEHDKHMTEVNSLFAQVDERRMKRDVPDYLCGKISFELMREPVITRSGITYDRKDIEEHLQDDMENPMK